MWRITGITLDPQFDGLNEESAIAVFYFFYLYH